MMRRPEFLMMPAPRRPKNPGRTVPTILLLYSPTGEYNKIEIFKMAASRFVEVDDKEISEIKMNSDQKNTKKLVQKY